MYGPNPNYQPWFSPMPPVMPMSYEQAMEAKKTIEDYEKRLKKDAEDALLKKQEEEKKKKGQKAEGPSANSIMLCLVGLSPIIAAASFYIFVQTFIGLIENLKPFLK